MVKLVKLKHKIGEVKA